MGNPLSVLLVEDNVEECKAIARYIESTDDVRLIRVTNTAARALEYVEMYLPDAIILDLELHEGGGNGILFLKALKKKQLAFFPYILVTTNNVSNINHEGIRLQGVDFIMLKSQSDYGAKCVIEFLRTMKGPIQNSREKEQTSQVEELPSAEMHKRLLAEAFREMDLIGVKHKVVGRKYLIDGIMLTIDGHEQDIFRAIAKKYGKTTESVRRAAQTAIDGAWKGANIEELSKHYTARVDSATGGPTLMNFIRYYANKIELKQ